MLSFICRFEGVWLRAFLRLLNSALAIAMIVAGTALAYLPWINVAQAPGSDAFGLIQVHFLLTGAFSLWAVSSARRDGLIASFSLLMLGLNAWLAFLALIAPDKALLWAVIFAVVSAVNYGFLLVSDVKTAEPGESLAAPPDPEAADDDGLVAPDYGAAKPIASDGRAQAAVMLIVLQIGLTLALLFFGALYGALLKEVIIERNEISVAKLIESLAGGAANEALIIIVVTVAAYGVLHAVAAIISWLIKNKDGRGPGAFDRLLSRAERDYISNARLALERYLEALTYKPLWRALYVAGVIGVIVSFTATPLAVVMLETMIDELLRRSGAAGGAALHYAGALYIGGVVGGFFAGGGLLWSLFQWLGARYPQFGEYLFAGAGWNSLNNRPRTLEELVFVLVRHVRAGLLDVQKPFEPFVFLVGSFRERESIVYKSTAWAVIATVFLAAADLTRFELVDERGVTYAHYLQMSSRRVEFSELDRIEVRCVLYRPDKQGRINLGLDYLLVKDGAFRIDLLSDFESDSGRLARLEALDAELARLGVSVMRAATAGFLQGERVSFIATCSEEISARFEAPVAARLGKLLRVATFAGMAP